MAGIERHMHPEGRKQTCQRAQAPTRLWQQPAYPEGWTIRTGPSCLGMCAVHAMAGGYGLTSKVSGDPGGKQKDLKGRASTCRHG